MHQMNLQQSQPTLMNLPSEVICNILSFISTNDILHLRSTCPTAVEFVSDYRRKLRKRLSTSIMVISTEDNFRRFCDDVIYWPFSKFQLEFPINVDAIQPSVELFLKHHGEDIKFLALRQLYFEKEETKMYFFNQMPNLESLRIMKSSEIRIPMHENIGVATPKLADRTFNQLRTIDFEIDLSNISYVSGFENPKNDGKWPNIEDIKIAVHLTQACLKPGSIREKRILSLLDFVLNERRNSLTSLSISTGNLKSKMHMSPSNWVSNMNNMTSLVLDVPNYSENDYSDLLSELARKTKLTHLNLTIRCPIFDSTFIGNDVGRPKFLELTGLKHCFIKIVLDTNTGRLSENVLIGATRSFIEEVVPRSSLSCLVLKCIRYPIFPVNTTTVSRVLEGNLCTNLRYISWADGGPVRNRAPECKEAFKTLKLRVKVNRSKQSLVLPNSCKYCETL